MKNRAQAPVKDLAPGIDRSFGEQKASVLVHTTISNGQISSSDLNAELLARLLGGDKTSAEMEQWIEDIRWTLRIFKCSCVLGGLPHVPWDVAKHMTFTEYMDEVEGKTRTAA